MPFVTTNNSPISHLVPAVFQLDVLTLFFFLLMQRNSLCTIRNNANVCSVQFSAQSTYLLAFSTADYKTYCYDLRNISTPWCILAGHEKAVSYAKFLDNETLVSASTDNTLKIWDLNKTNSNGLSRDACVLTLRGHTNEKVATPLHNLNSFNSDSDFLYLVRHNYNDYCPYLL